MQSGSINNQYLGRYRPSSVSMNTLQWYCSIQAFKPSGTLCCRRSCHICTCFSAESHAKTRRGIGLMERLVYPHLLPWGSQFVWSLGFQSWVVSVFGQMILICELTLNRYFKVDLFNHAKIWETDLTNLLQDRFVLCKNSAIFVELLVRLLTLFIDLLVRFLGCIFIYAS